MISIIRAYIPRLIKLATESANVSNYLDNAPTDFQKKAFLMEKSSTNSQLVRETLKLGSSVLQSLKANKAQEETIGEDKKYKRDREATDEEEKEAMASMSPLKALGLGAAIAAPATLAANYTLGKASDEMDSKMWAIPGLAAATVGAILAARNTATSEGITPETLQVAEELEGALNAKEVIDTAINSNLDNAEMAPLSKLSQYNEDHISAMVRDLLLIP